MAQMAEAAGNATFVVEFLVSNYAHAREVAAGYADRLFGGGGTVYAESFEFSPGPYGKFRCRYALSTLQP